MKEELLTEARTEINEIDRQLAELFVQRMKAVEKVAEYKKAHSMPIFDAKREQQLLAKGASAVDDAVLREYYVRFQQALMDVSKDYQQRLIG